MKSDKFMQASTRIYFYVFVKSNSIYAPNFRSVPVSEEWNCFDNARVVYRSSFPMTAVTNENTQALSLPSDVHRLDFSLQH